MSREQERIRRKLESNPVVECNEVRNRYCPDLFCDFADTKDPRNQSYIEYSNDELQKVLQKQVYGLIRSKAFYDARFQKKWLVIVDGTQIYSGKRKLNDGCLERHYNKGTEEETVNYHCDVLEAKIVLGESLIVSIASEFIENNGEDAERQKNMSEEKQKAFKRLPVILLADSLYASEPVMDICRDNKWEFIIRYKTGSIPSITEEYEKIPGKEM